MLREAFALFTHLHVLRSLACDRATLSTVDLALIRASVTVRVRVRVRVKVCDIASLLTVDLAPIRASVTVRVGIRVRVRVCDRVTLSTVQVSPRQDVCSISMQSSSAEHSDMHSVSGAKPPDLSVFP